jgi:hypothetical protein
LFLLLFAASRYSSLPFPLILAFVTAEPRRILKSLEDSPDYFWERFSSHTTRLGIGPEPLGSPMLELITPFGPLYTFDRGVVPLHGGVVEVLLHGQVEEWQTGEAEPRVQYLGQGRYELGGQVEELLGTDFFVLGLNDQEVTLRVLLSSSELPPRGSWVVVAPPYVLSCTIGVGNSESAG